MGNLINFLFRINKPCEHKNKNGMDWPDGGYVEVCKDCGKSRHIWEQGESDWIMIKDVEGEKKAIEASIKYMLENPQQKRTNCAQKSKAKNQKL